MIHLKLTDASLNTFYLSEIDQEIPDGASIRFWKDQISGISPVRMDLDYEYGGMLRVSGSGTISISPETFENLAKPPLKLIVDARWFNPENQNITYLFFSTGYLKTITSTEITYSLFTQEIDVNLLQDDTSSFGSGQDRVLPMAFGTIEMEEAMRVGSSTDYTYYKAGIQGADASVYDVYEDGRQKNKYTGADYEGTIKDNGDGTFKSIQYDDDTTTNEPYGTIRISGDNNGSFSHNSITYYMDKLDGVFAYCLNLINSDLGTSYTLNTTYSRTTIPDVGFYQTEQINVLDFLSEISSYFSHCFYIDEENSTFYLIDMFKDRGSQVLSSDDGVDVDFFTASYEYPKPVKELTATWEVIQASTDTDGYPTIVTESKSQKVAGDNTFGISKEFTRQFINIQSNVITAMKNIGDLIQAPVSDIKVPYEIGAVLGKKYTWTDQKLEKPSSVYIRARGMVFDPINYEITINGQVFAS